MDHSRLRSRERACRSSRSAGAAVVATRDLLRDPGLQSQQWRAIQFRALDICGQATKGAWGMSWRQKTMTGVEDCEKLGVVVKQTLIPKFPNQPALNP